MFGGQHRFSFSLSHCCMMIHTWAELSHLSFYRFYPFPRPSLCLLLCCFRLNFLVDLHFRFYELELRRLKLETTMSLISLFFLLFLDIFFFSLLTPSFTSLSLSPSFTLANFFFSTFLCTIFTRNSQKFCASSRVEEQSMAQFSCVVFLVQENVDLVKQFIFLARFDFNSISSDFLHKKIQCTPRCVHLVHKLKFVDGADYLKIKNPLRVRNSNIWNWKAVNQVLNERVAENLFSGGSNKDLKKLNIRKNKIKTLATRLIANAPLIHWNYSKIFWTFNQTFSLSLLIVATFALSNTIKVITFCTFCTITEE